MIRAIELYFDSAADEAVRQLWHHLAQAGISDSMHRIGAVPHLSLVVADHLPTTEVMAHLQQLTQTITPPTVALSHLGIFASGVVFLGVTASAALVEVHRRVTTAIQPLARGVNPYYAPEAWVPHCTLAFGVATANLGQAASACLPHLHPIQASITSIGLVEVDSVKVTELAQCMWEHLI